MFYLKDIIIENVGPIEKLDIELPFNTDGNPKPVILVGENGTGKTIALAHIIDSILEFANQSYENALPRKSQGYSYFKIIGMTNQKVGSQYGFCFLNFADDDKRFQYIDKTGKLSFNDCKSKTRELLTLNSGWK